MTTASPNCDFGGFRHRHHRRDAAIERRRLLVAQLDRKLQDPGPGQDVAILAKAAEKMRILIREVMAVFAHAVTLLRHVEDVAVITLPVEEIFAPGDAVADHSASPRMSVVDAFADFLDNADDFMPENSRAWIWPAALVGMNIRAANRRHRDSDQNFAALGGTNREFLQDERCIRGFVNGSLACAHYSTPLSAKSKIS